MTDRGTATRTTARTRARAAAALALVAACAAAAGCDDRDAVEPPNAVDAGRLAAVRADPVLAGGLARPASVRTGSGASPFLRAQIVVTDAVVPELRARDARAAGWRVTYAACRDPQQAAGPAATVQAFRTMPAPAAGGGAFTVGLRIEDGRATAVIPYHLDATDPFHAPAAAVPAAESCAENGTTGDAGSETTVDAQAPPLSAG